MYYSTKKVNVDKNKEVQLFCACRNFSKLDLSGGTFGWKPEQTGKGPLKQILQKSFSDKKNKECSFKQTETRTTGSCKFFDSHSHSWAEGYQIFLSRCMARLVWLFSPFRCPTMRLHRKGSAMVARETPCAEGMALCATKFCYNGYTKRCVWAVVYRKRYHLTHVHDLQILISCWRAPHV